MKSILLVSVFVLLEIVSCDDANNKIKARLEKRFEWQEKSNHHGAIENHKSGHHEDARAPPSPHNGNGHEKFQRYLEKWEKFSKPETRWYQARKNNDKKEHVEKDDLKHTNIRGHHKMMSPVLKIESRDNLKEKILTKNELRDKVRGGQIKKGFHDEMKKLSLEKDQHKDMKTMKDRKLSEQEEHKGFVHHMDHFNKQNINDRQMHNFGRRAHGDKPFARSDGKNSRHDIFCTQMQDRKCQDDKREVCGSDGKTYQNRCLFMAEMCKKDNKAELKILKRGACEETKILH